MKRMHLIDLQKVIIEDVEKPVPGKDEVLIRVAKCGVCGTDIHAFYGRHPYIHTPIVLGHEFSGTITELGEGVDKLEVGQRVTVLPHLGCNNCKPCAEERYNWCEELRCIGCQAVGAYAEYITVPAKVVFPLYEGQSFREGAMIEPTSVAYHGVRLGMKKGDVALIMGAGLIGIMAMQFTKILGAEKVVIADVKQNRLDFAQSLGVADGIINLANESLEDGLTRLVGSPKNVDFFGDYVGAGGQALDSIIRVARRGAHITCVGIIANDFHIPHIPDIIEHELTIHGSSMFVPQDFLDVIEYMRTGQVKTDGFITRCYDLEDMPAMYEMVDKKQEDFMKLMVNVSKEEASEV